MQSEGRIPAPETVCNSLWDYGEPRTRPSKREARRVVSSECCTFIVSVLARLVTDKGITAGVLIEASGYERH